METFYNPDATKSALRSAGETCVRAVYGFNPTKYIELNVMRFMLFQKSVQAKRTIACNLSLLPPTSETLYQHSLRVYLQIQTWLGREDFNPLDFGWKKSDNGLMPITNNQPAIPESLIEKIKCSCRKGCKTNACSCRSNDKKCSAICRFCKGANCTNAPNEIMDEDDEDDVAFADDESENLEMSINVNEDSVYTSTDYFDSETSTDYASESDTQNLDSSIYEPVCEIDEDIYDSDEASEISDLNDSGHLKKRKTML